MIPSLLLKADECAVSFAMRVAADHGFASLYEFQAVTGIVLPLLQGGDETAIGLLADWQNVRQTALVKFAFGRGPIIEFGQARLRRSHFKTGSVRYCPACLRCDMETESGNPKTRPYLRGAWGWRGISSCSIHGIRLRTLKLSDAFNLGLPALGDSGAATTLVEQAPSASVACDAYFAARIAGQSGDSFLDDLPAYVAAELCGVLGGFQQSSDRGAVSKRVTGGKMASRARWDGFHVAKEGRQAIDQFLTRCVASSVGRVPMWSRNYAPATDWLMRKRNDPDYATVIDLFQVHAVNHLPLCPGDTFIVPVEERKVHSLRSAAAQYKLSEDRVSAIVTELGADIFDDRRFFRVDTTHERLAEEATHLLVPEAALLLGLTLPQFERLLKAGILNFKALNPEADRLYRHISRADLSELAVRLFTKVGSASPGKEMVPLRFASARCNCTVFDIISLIAAGLLENIAVAGPEMKIDKLLIDVEEVKERLTSRQQKRDDFLAVRDLEHALQTTTATVDELIKRGYLTPTTLPHHKTKKPQIFVSRTVLAAFQVNYVSLSALSKQVDMHPRLVRSALELEGISTLFEPHGKIARFYHRTDVKILFP